MVSLSMEFSKKALSRCRPGMRHRPRTGAEAPRLRGCPGGLALLADLDAILGEALEDRGVAEAEQVDACVVGGERAARPGKDRDQVALSEVVLDAVDDRGARALEDLEDRGADLAPCYRGCPGAEPVELGADRPHHVAAGRGVGEADRGVSRLPDTGVRFCFQRR